MILKKNDIRKKYIKIRNNLSFVRRSLAAKKSLKILNLNFENILSFASKPKEINLWSLNKKLAIDNRLFLPKVNGSALEIYEVNDVDSQLTKGSFNILEPADTCKKIDPKDISCVLVPAVVFDKNNNRLGYGRGFYDKFLSTLKCPILGIGFLEQLYTQTLPINSYDIKVDHLLLF